MIRRRHVWTPAQVRRLHRDGAAVSFFLPLSALPEAPPEHVDLILREWWPEAPSWWPVDWTDWKRLRVCREDGRWRVLALSYLPRAPLATFAPLAALLTHFGTQAAVDDRKKHGNRRFLNPTWQARDLRRWARSLRLHSNEAAKAATQKAS